MESGPRAEPGAGAPPGEPGATQRRRGERWGASGKPGRGRPAGRGPLPLPSPSARLKFRNKGAAAAATRGPRGIADSSPSPTRALGALGGGVLGGRPFRPAQCHLGSPPPPSCPPGPAHPALRSGAAALHPGRHVCPRPGGCGGCRVSGWEPCMPSAGPAPRVQARAPTSPPPVPPAAAQKGLLLLLLLRAGGEGREGRGGPEPRLPSNPPDKGEGEGEAALFGARAGAGEWAASPAAGLPLEPTRPEWGRKGTEPSASPSRPPSQRLWASVSPRRRR